MSTISSRTGYVFSEVLPIRLVSKALQLQWRVCTMPWTTFLFWLSCCCSLLLRFLIIAGAPPGEFYNKTKVSMLTTVVCLHIRDSLGFFQSLVKERLCIDATYMIAWLDTQYCQLMHTIPMLEKLQRLLTTAGEGSKLRCGASAAESAGSQKHNQGDQLLPPHHLPSPSHPLNSALRFHWPCLKPWGNVSI